MRIPVLVEAFVVGALVCGCSQVDYIDIEPSAVMLRHKEDSLWMRAVAKSQTGNQYPKEKISWSVKDPSIATVDSAGRLKAVSAGMTELVARHGRVEASIPVEVVLPAKLLVEPKFLTLSEGGEPREVSVKVFDMKGRLLKDRNPTFKSLDPEVVSVGQNAAFPVNAGKARLEVRVDDLTELVDVTVTPEPVAKRK